MENEKGLLTDFSGVMVHDGFASLEKHEKRYGIESGRLQEAKNRLWVDRFRVDPDMRAEDFWKQCFREAGKELDEEEIAKINSKVLESHYPYDDMFGLVGRLKEGGVKTGLITNTSKDWFEYFDNRFGLSDLFQVIVTSYDIGEGKPSSAIFNEARKRMGVPFLYVDDQTGNIEATTKHGYKNVLLFKSPEQAIPKIADFFGVEYEG